MIAKKGLTVLLSHALPPDRQRPLPRGMAPGICTFQAKSGRSASFVVAVNQCPDLGKPILHTWSCKGLKAKMGLPVAVADSECQFLIET
jgi:hypothetical protein